jgi:hypothetical protein
VRFVEPEITKLKRETSRRLTSSFFDQLRCRKSPDRGFGMLGSHWSSRFVILSIVRHVFENFEKFNNNDPLEAGPVDVAQRGVNSFIKLLCLCADVQYFMLLSMCILHKQSLIYVLQIDPIALDT